MYSSRPGLILGFHGCDKSIVPKVVAETQQLKFKENSFDWLGHGAYFWEHSPSRAFEYADAISKNSIKSRRTIKAAAVIGAVIDLGHCLDLLDYKNLSEVKDAYEFLLATYKNAGFKLPRNRAPKNSSSDLLLRDLDCAVIETVHKTRKDKDFREYDSVRGVFWEGQVLYENAGFREKDHIQICIRNPNCVKGFFIPRVLDADHSAV